MGEWLGGWGWWLVAGIGLCWVLFAGLMLALMRAGAMSDRCDETMLEEHRGRAAGEERERFAAGARPSTFRAPVRRRSRARSRS